MFAMALNFLLNSNLTQYPNNLFCISMESNAFSKSIDSCTHCSFPGCWPY